MSIVAIFYKLKIIFIKKIKKVKKCGKSVDKIKAKVNKRKAKK